MSLTSCPECKKEISDKAQTCPHCGAPAQRVKKSSILWPSLGGMSLILLAAVVFNPTGCGGAAEKEKPAQLLGGMADIVRANGLLCPSPVDVYKVTDKTWCVVCAKTTDGYGRVEYIVDMDTGKAFKKD